jgi:hypothetical protein
MIKYFIKDEKKNRYYDDSDLELARKTGKTVHFLDGTIVPSSKAVSYKEADLKKAKKPKQKTNQKSAIEAVEIFLPRAGKIEKIEKVIKPVTGGAERAIELLREYQRMHAELVESLLKRLELETGH